MFSSQLPRLSPCLRGSTLEEGEGVGKAITWMYSNSSTASWSLYSVSQGTVLPSLSTNGHLVHSLKASFAPKTGEELLVCLPQGYKKSLLGGSITLPPSRDYFPGAVLPPPEDV